MGRNSKRVVIMLSAAGFAIASSSCGNASETGIEKLIESQGGGDVDLDLDGDGGFSVQTEEGGMSIDEDGNFVITDADGSVVTGNADADTGEFVVESEDGSFSSGSTSELPEEWPADIPEPDGLAISSATVIGSATEQAITVTGSVDSVNFVDSYGSALESAGLEEESTFTSDGTVNNVYRNDQWTVGVLYYGDANSDQLTVSIYSNS
ncbi:MAG TPA: hypothetical protein VMY16_08830 [Ilumatobacteraceae bacterium]|nr:hypothetical protein [Ilumatobacteraceae bacterium]